MGDPCGRPHPDGDDHKGRPVPFNTPYGNARNIRLRATVSISMKRLRISQRTLTLVALALLISTLALIAGLYTWLLADLPPVSTVETRLVRPTTRILDRNGRLLYEVIDPEAGKQIDLSLNDVPEACIQATLATEDSRFFLHPGVDPIAIGRALFQNFSADGQIVSGASTLTQQMARTLLMDPDERYEQSVRRKLREAWLALRLEFRYTKSELLALYLNQTYYGNWAYGIEAASQVFYAKPAAQLSRAECAVLAGLIQYPFGYSPLQHPEVAKGRQLTVLASDARGRIHHRRRGSLAGRRAIALPLQSFRHRSPSLRHVHSGLDGRSIWHRHGT